MRKSIILGYIKRIDLIDALQRVLIFLGLDSQSQASQINCAKQLQQQLLLGDRIAAPEYYTGPLV